MKIGRNDLCLCGSGIKYKKCCIFSATTKEVSNSSIAEENPESDTESAKVMLEAFQGIRNMMLKSKPHIKQYLKIRQLHSEIVNSMMDYYYDGRFEPTINPDYVYPKHMKKPEEDTLLLFESSFDTNTREGIQGLADMLIYKSAPNISCITEEFINRKRYRKPEKVEFLECMLNSALGLYEAIETDKTNGYVFLREIFTGQEHKVTDIGMSGVTNNDINYLYTRLLSYKGITINTGLSLVFSKGDPFIKDFIKRHRHDYTPLGDLVRFCELYNKYTQTTEDRVEVQPNTFK